MRTVDADLVVAEYESGKTVSQVAKVAKCSLTTEYKILREAGIPIRSRSDVFTTKRETVLNNEHRSVLDGLLLGDGSVLRPRQTAMLTLSSIQQGFVEAVRSLLPLEFSPMRFRPASVRMIDGKECNCKDKHTLNSKVDKSLNEYRDKWYPEGKKIVPQNLVLNPTVVRHWFYGDGCSKWVGTGKRYVSLQLCSDCFTESENHLLEAKLNEIGLDFKVERSKKYFRLFCYTIDSINKFFDYVGTCDIPCFLYKWKIPSHSLKRKLDYEKARKIRDLYVEGWGKKQMAQMFDVHLETVRKVIRKARWKSVA